MFAIYEGDGARSEGATEGETEKVGRVCYRECARPTEEEERENVLSDRLRGHYRPPPQFSDASVLH